MTNDEIALAIEAMRAENEKRLAEMGRENAKLRQEVEALKPKPDPPPSKPWEPPWAGIGYDNYIMDQLAKVPSSQARDMMKVRDQNGNPVGVDRRDGRKEDPALPIVRVIC